MAMQKSELHMSQSGQQIWTVPMSRILMMREMMPGISEEEMSSLLPA